MEAFGMMVEGSGFERESREFEIWPENWESVIAFLACETQWRTSSTLTHVYQNGIDYAGADVVMRRFGSPDHVFGDLRIMERAALAVFKEAI